MFLLALLFAVCSAQQIIDLKTFRGGNVNNEISKQTTYAIYVSATSDDDVLLKQIYVMSNDGNSVTLYQLKTKKLIRNSGQLQPYAIMGTTAFVRTSLSDTQMNSLTGLMYISTAKQLNNNLFYVIDVDGQQTVDLTPNLNTDSTVVFLNTNMKTSPFQSTTISGWTQKTDAHVSLYPGVPTDTAEADSTEIFKNPMHTKTFDQMFTNVEKFSLSLGAFYLKTYKGVKLTLQPGYYDIDQSSTTSTTTTGFYMKPVNAVDRTVTITTIRDTGYSGEVGANVLGDLPALGQVSVGEYDGASHDSTSFPPISTISPWRSPHIGQTFQISSSGGQYGEFYCQYYVVQGAPTGQSTANPNSPTLPPINPTSTRIPTTTRSSQSLQIFISSVITIIGARFV